MSLESKAELLWKWTLRLVGLAGFLYVLIAKDGEVALEAWVIIGGLIGLPNALPLGQVIETWKGTKP